MIAITDYGLGNIKAFANLYYKLNIPVIIARKSDDFRDATKIILPGVGSFDYAMQRLNDSGMRETLDQKVLKEKIPVIGICVGMQMLAQRSEEGNLPGLGWIEGEVKKFVLPSGSTTMRIPHMGWNTINPAHTKGLLKVKETDSRFNLLHYYLFNLSKPPKPTNPNHPWKPPSYRSRRSREKQTPGAGTIFLSTTVAITTNPSKQASPVPTDCFGATHPPILT